MDVVRHDKPHCCRSCSDSMHISCSENGVFLLKLIKILIIMILGFYFLRFTITIYCVRCNHVRLPFKSIILFLFKFYIYFPLQLHRNMFNVTYLYWSIAPDDFLKYLIINSFCPLPSLNDKS